MTFLNVFTVYMLLSHNVMRAIDVLFNKRSLTYLREKIITIHLISDTDCDGQCRKIIANS